MIFENFQRIKLFFVMFLCNVNIYYVWSIINVNNKYLQWGPPKSTAKGCELKKKKWSTFILIAVLSIIKNITFLWRFLLLITVI